MKFDTLQSCIHESLRLTKKMRLLHEASESWHRDNPTMRHIPIDFAKQTAEVRRASMDVTRELAKLRQNK